MFIVRPNFVSTSPSPRLGVALLRVSVLAFALLFALPFAALAQSSQGSINGRVTDPKGALIPKAQVTITNVDTKEEFKTRTNGSGAYNVESLNPGTYNVTISAPGFETSITEKVLVSTAQAVETSAKLAIGNESISVTVTSQDSLLSKESDVSTTVDHELVENLPYPERSALEAVLLVPGVEGDPTQVGGIASENPGYLTGQVTPGASVRIGGSPPGSHAHLIDGSDVVQSSYGRVGISLSGLAVQETTVITAGMSAKYGRTGSGVIVQSSRTGTDQLHGQLNWRHTDPFFNAYPLGGNAPNNNHQNFYTASVGGPVYIPFLYKKKDRTFFHVDVEPAVFRRTVNVRGQFFTPDELAGKLYGSTQTGTSPIFYHSVINAQGFPAGPEFSGSSQYVKITGPLADCPASFIAANPTATTCPNDLAPQLANNPFARYVLGLEPTPTNPGPYVHFDNPDGSFSPGQTTNASYDRGVFNNDYRYNIRIDHQINQRSQVYVRYSTTPNVANRFFALSTDSPLSQSPTDRTISRDVAIGYTRVLSNNLVANFRYSWLRVNQTRTQNYSSTSQDFAAKYGLTPATSGVGFPNLGTFDDETLKPGSLTGFYALDQNFIVGQDFNYTRGRHLFQFGGEYRWIQSNQEDLSGVTGGTYSFADTQTSGSGGTGSSLATFILGTISSFQNSPQPIPEYYRWRYFASYFQDDWRATAKLTINMGVRYNVETPRLEKFDNQGSIVFQPGTLAVSPTVSQSVTAGFCFSGTCGLPRTLWPTNYASVEPRIGLAYAVASKVVLRGSYTLSHLPLTGYGNMPRTDLDGGTSTSSTSGGTVYPTGITNYVSNPVVVPVGGYATFNAMRGQPIYTSTAISPDYVDQTNKVPYIQAWAASIQFQPAAKSKIDISYSGSKGTHLIGAFTNSINAPSLAKLVGAIQSNQYLGTKTPNSYGITGVNGILMTETAFQKLNTYQNFFNQNLPEIYPRNGSLHYNALYISFNQRFNKHFTVLSSYVWAKTLDNVPTTNTGSEGANGIASDQDSDDNAHEWSLASYDYPSRLRTAFHIVLPFGKKEKFRTHFRPLDAVLSDIRAAGIITSASGKPNTIALGSSGYFYSLTPPGVNGCAAGTTVCNFAGIPSGFQLRPNIVPGVPLINPHWKDDPFGKAGPATQYLNPAAFSVPGSPGNPQLGNAPRTLGGGRTPRTLLFDANASKSIRIREKYQLRLAIQAQNVMNHPAYFQIGTNTPYTTSSVSASGVITNKPNTSFGHLDQSSTQGISRTVYVAAHFIF